MVDHEDDDDAGRQKGRKEGTVSLKGQETKITRCKGTRDPFGKNT